MRKDETGVSAGGREQQSGDRLIVSDLEGEWFGFWRRHAKGPWRLILMLKKTMPGAVSG
jgi:hypothetical protein